jgi:hypothetical protein
MTFRARARHVASVLIAILFAISIVAEGFAATGAALKMSGAAMQTSVTDQAMECCGDQQATLAACVAACATTGAIPCEPAVLPKIILSQNIPIGIEITRLGRSVPPEPDPPRTVHMS